MCSQPKRDGLILAEPSAVVNQTRLDRGTTIWSSLMTDNWRHSMGAHRSAVCRTLVGMGAAALPRRWEFRRGGACRPTVVSTVPRRYSESRGTVACHHRLRNRVGTGDCMVRHEPDSGQGLASWSARQHHVRGRETDSRTPVIAGPGSPAGDRPRCPRVLSSPHLARYRPGLTTGLAKRDGSIA